MSPDLKRRLLRAMTGGAVAIAAVLVQWNEGIRHKPYKDGGDVLTVCYGHTGKAVIPGNRYTDEECQALLEKDLKAAMAVVEIQVTVPLTEMQKAALTSFVYNVGRGAFARSTLLQKLNVGDRQGACDEMRRWKYDEGKVSKGLVNRRVIERELCLLDTSFTPTNKEVLSSIRHNIYSINLKLHFQRLEVVINPARQGPGQSW